MVAVGGVALVLGVIREVREGVSLIERTNLVLPTADSLAQGGAIYLESCVLCHGSSGLRDGPVGVTLNPRPANLAVHMIPGVHTDGQILEWVTNGLPNSQMPGFGDSYCEEERCHLINYIRTFATVEEE